MCKKLVVVQLHLCYEMEVASLFNKLLVSSGEQTVFRLYFS